MSDLVKRLWESDAASSLTNEAARRIEQLERELAEASGLIAQIKDEIRDTEDAHRSEVDFADHLKSELAAEKALADRLYVHWQAWCKITAESDEDDLSMWRDYRKARGVQ